MNLEAETFLRQDYSPLPGRCVIELDEVAQIGSILIPESARGPKLGQGDRVRDTDRVYFGRVIKFGPRRYTNGEYEEDLTGKRVVLALRGTDLGQKVIVTHNTRIRAVVDDFEYHYYRDKEIRMTYDEFLSSLMLWREARSCSQSAKAAILAVVRNRMTDPQHRWPTTIPGVILQPKQFSSFNLGDPNSTKFPQPSANPAKANPPDWMAWLDCVEVATVPLTADPTHGANHYESCGEGVTRPSWADPSRMTVEIGPFRFYKL